MEAYESIITDMNVETPDWFTVQKDRAIVLENQKYKKFKVSSGRMSSFHLIVDKSINFSLVAARKSSI